MEHFLTSWGYVALFVATMISAMGIPTGAEIVTGYAGALSSGHLLTGPHDHLNLAVVIIVASVGEVVGCSLGYLVGRVGGRPLINKVGKYVLLTNRDVDRAEAWFARHGDSTVFFGRFVPLLRSFLSLAAGIAEMSFAKFIVFSAIACSMWCALLASVGYALGQSWHHVLKDFSLAGYVLTAVAIVVIVAAAYHRIVALRHERELAGDR